MSTDQGRGVARERGAKDRSDAHYLQAVSDFDTAVLYFQKQKYDKAKEFFQKLAHGPVTEIAARARVHLQFCDQRLKAESSPAAKTAEDYYNLGVFALNEGRVNQALEHLVRADKLAPRQDHILYALAAGHARRGNTDSALTHLRRAIELRPGNRFQARRDEDFRSLTNDPRFKQLTG